MAACDLLLLPPVYEPYGALQMYAHRYGALPVARKTGSVADTVVDCDSNLGTGNGFLFEDNSPEAYLAAVQRGASAFHRRPAFEELRRRVMQIDHSWERCARRFEYLHRGLASEQPAAVPAAS